MSSALSVTDVTVAYSQQPVLWDIHTEIPEGQIVGIIGPNGAGKSTFIKAVMGLVPLLSGDVKVFGESLSKSRHLLGYVPQRSSVDWDFPTNALDVVLMGRYGKVRLFQRPRAIDQEIALDCLDKLGMADFAHRQISQLSGGQQQRVFLARALAQDAQIYLMDEPFAGVDATTEQAIIQLLRELQKQGKTVVVVHHDLYSVPEYFDWVLLLNGRLVSSGPTEEVFTEEKLRETYGGSIRLLGQISKQLIKQRSGTPES